MPCAADQLARTQGVRVAEKVVQCAPEDLLRYTITQGGGQGTTVEFAPAEEHVVLWRPWLQAWVGLVLVVLTWRATTPKREDAMKVRRRRLADSVWS